MNPGIVFSSFTRNPRPPSSKKKSTRAIASQRHACERLDRERPHLRGRAPRRAAPGSAARPRRPRTCRRTCRTPRPARPRPGPTPPAARRRAPPTSISRPSTASSATIHSSNSSAWSIAASSSARSCALLTPTDEPMFAGFTKHGQPELALDRVGERGAVLAVAQHEVVRLRQAARGERALHHHLVHADRGADDPGAHVRQVGQLEQPLDGAVLAVRTVQQREHDVDAEAAAPGMRHRAAELVELRPGRPRARRAARPGRARSARAPRRRAATDPRA